MEDQMIQRRESCLSKLVGRSASSKLVMESISCSEWAPLPAYKRLSKSMRLLGEAGPQRRRKYNKVLKLIGRVFARGESVQKVAERDSVTCSAERKKKNKKRCSWLPDPDRRWPVQGW